MAQPVSQAKTLQGAAPPRPLSAETLAAIKQAVITCLLDDDDVRAAVALALPLAPPPAVPDLPKTGQAAATTADETVEVGAAQVAVVMDLVERKIRQIIRPDALRRPGERPA